MLKKISAQLIIRTVKNREETRALALAFAVKSTYLSSQINNFSYSRLSEMFGISRATAKKRMNTLKTLGLVRENGDHMVFLSLQEIGVGIKNINIQNHKKKVNNLKEIEKFIRLQAVYIKQTQIDFAVNTIEAKQRVKKNKDLKSLNRRAKKLKDWAGETDRGQSINTVSRISGLSKKSSVELLKWGQEKKFLRKKVRIEATDVSSFGKIKLLKEVSGKESYFAHNGIIFSVMPTILKFNKRNMV